jgi:hypothetical protein
VTLSAAGPEAPTSRVVWRETHRLVLSHFPLIDLYDDVADPHDWEALASAQARTNPRIWDEIGDLSLVPVARRVGGPGASWVMGAFTHVSPDRVSRFSDGGYGVYYAGDRLATALYEHTHHMGRFYAAAGMEAAWLSEVRQLVGRLDAGLLDLRGPGFARLLDPDDYGPSQAFARQQRGDGADGIVYPSVRHAPGQCIAAFYPDVVGVPAQGDHFRYFWDGSRITYARKITGDRAILAL